jgi:uncharacterized protein YndB with AHSA1/START domain
MTTTNDVAADFLGREFTITREFAAPRELVFRTWTEAKHVAQWWSPKGFTNPVCEWDARPGGKVYVVMQAPNGTRYPMGGEFREVVAPERLVLTTGALDEQGNLMFELLHTVTFAEENGQTALTIQSEVIKTSPGAGKYIGGYQAGMSQSLERLADRIEHLPLVVERTFDAPIAKVWQALTDVEAMRQWYFDLKEFRAEVGFEFGFTVEHEGTTFVHLCRVTEAVPPQRLAYTWRYEGHAGDSLVTMELSAAGQGTRLKLTHSGLETFPKRPEFARKNFSRGWTSLIGSSLKEFLETK